MQFYLQHFNSTNINNEWTADVPQNGFLQISWFPHNDLLINGIKINTDTIRANTDFQIIQISDTKFLIRPPTTGKPPPTPNIKIDLELENTIIAGKYIINKKTNEYIEADKIDILKGDFVAVRQLHTKLGHTQIIKLHEKYTAREKNNHFFPKTEHDIALCFLECVRVGDFFTAEKFLSFITNDTQLQNYFGKFEILEFMGDLYIYEPQVIGWTMAKCINFQIENGKITNFNLTQ